ncbi:hypothetical protein PB2503_03852 [Parvularcula bermudensis HTCC2503]|uniref:Antitoxin FitA-like ribbon-helix-helix domain-containing protein n=1 Tax=Parvularcula bermudensis (strain ATCC BAA-594 / HTCC2503 / KCTC 12087) TaxID=314260 RepID=E0TE24_PARBH|nr:hypothetical protein [Parvularcula bermudensis]ADM08845.1 hypothetical protein PB2503_03852 [Parvularcula bermudensis HTCC2503]
MAQVLVRKLEEGVVSSLKRLAAEKGVSLEQYLRDVLTETAEAPSAAFDRLAADLRAATAQTAFDPAIIVREARER